jgi:hypothetical protein
LASGAPTTPVFTLTNPSPAAYVRFGISVALSNTRLVVGTYQLDTPLIDETSTYVYDLASATPTVPVATLSHAHATADGFGASVAVDGLTVVVGAPYVDTVAAHRGAAYIFALGPTLRFQTVAPNATTISWTPVDSPGFVLQQSDLLAPTNWVNAPSGALNPVTVATPTASRFYRLFKP